MVHVFGELMLSQGRGQHTDNTHAEEMLIQMLNVLLNHRRSCTHCLEKERGEATHREEAFKAALEV